MQDRENCVIAMFDALGAAKFNAEQRRRFIFTRDYMVGAIAETLKTMTIMSLATKQITTEQAMESMAQLSPTRYQFQDTIILTYSGSVTPIQAAYFYRWLGAHIYEWMESGFMMRGAFSIGSFIEDEKSTVLGPALVEAALSYESAQLVAVLLCESFAQCVVTALKTGGEYIQSIKPYYINYNTPIKLKNQVIVRKELWHLNWPQNLYMGYHSKDDAFQPRDVLSVVEERLADCHCEEVKLLNTLEFVEFCIPHIVDIV